jgi:hypothetical protein
LWTVFGMWNGRPIIENIMVVPLKTELPYDSANPPMGIYLKEGSREGTCTSMFIATCFQQVKPGRNPKCLSQDD